jgi:small subunit ribosomal protein S6
MRHYETTYILRPSLGEEQFSAVIERISSIITNDNGTLIDVSRWGLKKLAYDIKKEAQGYYVCMNYATPGSTIQELERIFRIDDRVLRYLTIKLADAIDAEGIELEKERIASLAAAAAKAAEGGGEAEDEDSLEDVEDDSEESKSY